MYVCTMYVYKYRLICINVLSMIKVKVRVRWYTCSLWRMLYLKSVVLFPPHFYYYFF